MDCYFPKMFCCRLYIYMALLYIGLCLGHGKSMADSRSLVLEEDSSENLGGRTIESNPLVPNDEVGAKGAWSASWSNEKDEADIESGLSLIEDGDSGGASDENNPRRRKRRTRRYSSTDIDDSNGDDSAIDDENLDVDNDDGEDSGDDRQANSSTRRKRSASGNDDDTNEDNDDSVDSDDELTNEDVYYAGSQERSVRKKRLTKREWKLSRSNHPLHVTLVMLDNTNHHIVKRTSLNDTRSTWPHRIPYVYKNFDKSLKHQLEAVLKFLEDQVCVTFVNEQNFDPDNPNWFKEHGYSTNAYIQFKSRSICAAVYGRGSKDKGSRNVSPCTQWGSMIHEVIHSLGGIHSQNYPHRERYITIHGDNIEKNLENNFRKYQPNSKEVEYEQFDPSSLLMYSRGYFTRNGQYTFDYVRPEMGKLTGPATYKNIIMELNKNYQCVELHCKNEDQDCSPGYMGYIKQKCACICPDGFNTDAKCKSIINAADTTIKWPNTPFSLNKGEECPSGTEEGRIPLNVGQYRMNFKRMPASNGVVNFDMCSKTSGSGDYESWPVGSYCIGKAEGVPCFTPFKEGTLTMSTKGTMTLTGSVGDVAVNGSKVTMKYCCRKEGGTGFPMKLPTTTAFRLTMNNLDCQEVDGMWTLPGYILLKGKASQSGASPRVAIQSNGMKITSCYYQPPTYGCSQDVTLDENNPTKTVSVPVGGGGREPNKRCFYYFQAPEGSRLRLTFEKLSLHPKDRVLVKRFNLLENPYQIDVRRHPHQMITERNKLYIEYWSYFENKSKSLGAEFKVDLLTPQGLCYDAATQGADYTGPKDISETYEPCLPWSEATSCPDFPWDQTHGLHLLNSGKSCRNLDSTGMLQPWCYTYINGTMCNRRYCDVCNEADPVDILDKCHKYIAGTPNFCTDALGRFGCFKSCGMQKSPYSKKELKCSKPDIPVGILARDVLQDSYDVGANVRLDCGRIECTPHGWTPFEDSCSDQCVDASQLCENTITKYPEFCTNERSKAVAEKYCRMTCGKCGSGASCSFSTGGSYSLAAGSPGAASTGQNVEFACNGGLIHVSGDLRRACSVSGALLGNDPVCQAAPVDINMEQIFVKHRNIPKSTAYLMLGNGIDVPFDGKITKWYYFCHNDLQVTMLVYRRTNDTKQFELVGSNKVPCIPWWPWSFDVPAGSRITVKKGDVLGVYDEKASIGVQSCQSAPEKWAPIVSLKIRNVKQLLKQKLVTFGSKSCAFVAVGARVDPN